MTFHQELLLFTNISLFPTLFHDEKPSFSISLQSSKFTIFLILFKKFWVKIVIRVSNSLVGAGYTVGMSLYLETLFLIQAKEVIFVSHFWLELLLTGDQSNTFFANDRKKSDLDSLKRNTLPHLTLRRLKRILNSRSWGVWLHRIIANLWQNAKEEGNLVLTTGLKT